MNRCDVLFERKIVSHQVDDRRSIFRRARSSTIQQRIEYRYDAQDNLVGRRRFTNGSTTAGQSSAFAHQNGQILLQLDKTGAGDLGYQDLSHRYLWGPLVDQLLADEQVDWTDSDPDGEVLWALTDHLGTVRDIVNNSATVVDHAEYSAFGKRLDPAAVDVVFGFTGKLFDEATGLQNNHRRWYDAAVGEWASEDFIWDGTNPHAYVGNKPTMLVDSTGLAGHHWIPRSVAKALRGRLSTDAYNYFVGGVTGGLPYIHRGDTWNGVTHAQYSDAVQQLLSQYIGKGTLDPTRAKAFQDAIANGICPDGLDPKRFADALSTVKQWRQGFLKSIVVAQAAADTARKRGITLSDEELKAIARLVVNEETTDELTRRARQVYSTLGPIRRSALTAAAKRVLPLIGVAVVLNDARRGLAQNGALGAGDEVIRGVVCADLVESIAFPAIQSGVDAVGDKFGLNDEGQRRLRQKRFGNLLEPYLEEEE